MVNLSLFGNFRTLGVYFGKFVTFWQFSNFGGCILVNLSLFGNFRTLGVYFGKFVAFWQFSNFGGCILVNLSLFGNFRTLGGVCSTQSKSQNRCL